MERIQEGKCTIEVPATGKISRDLPVFYNPVMKYNRDISVALLRQWTRNEIRVGLPLAGSGVRGVRLLSEVSGMEVHMNDGDSEACKCMRKNLKLNKCKATVYNKDANDFLRESMGFDYIDIDPFGSPNSFLDSAVKRIARDGILAVTATDTAPLCGTYPKAGMRKYWSVTHRGAVMHEIGLRILIRKVQLIGAQYDRALVPILSYSKDHYFRIFFLARKGKQKVDEVLDQHKHLRVNRETYEQSYSSIPGDMCGPLWSGKLHDLSLIGKDVVLGEDSFSKWLMAEDEADDGFVYPIHTIVGNLKLGEIPPRELIVDGVDGVVAHTVKDGVRSSMPYRKIIEIITRLSKRA